MLLTEKSAFFVGMWTIDPIDGTKGFLRGEQYAVCLSLIVDSKVQVGVIGCPNLPVDPAYPEKGTGCIFTAVRGKGAQQVLNYLYLRLEYLELIRLFFFQWTLSGANPTPLSIPKSTPDSLNFLESVEAAHSSHSFNDRVSALLNITRPPTRMDSQAKYGCLARGDGGAYLRMPTGVGYKEKIWVCQLCMSCTISLMLNIFDFQDHAPGQILVEEAGGILTDSRGEALNFGLGRTLGENYGVIAAGKDVHPRILEAVQKALVETKAKV